MELKIKLTAKQSLFDRDLENFENVLFGGAKGGGKSHGLRNIMLKRRIEKPGSIGVIFRRSYPELDGNHIRPLFNQFPALKEYFNETKKILTLPNRSVLMFRYLQSAKDLPNYQGQEFHDLAIEEAGQWTEEMYSTLKGSNRCTLEGSKARCLLTANPGGIGHKWLKRLFITRDFRPEEDPAAHHFIPAKVDDNPVLMKNDPGYKARLAAEKNPLLRRAYLEGDWDIQAGQFFSEFRRDVHVVAPITIPSHWRKFAAYDYGFNHPASWIFFAVDEDGNVYVYRERLQPHWYLEEQAKWLKSLPDFSQLSTIWAGRDCWTNKTEAFQKLGAPGKGAPNVAEEFASYGIRQLKPANIDRKHGAARIRMFLRYTEEAASDGQITRLGPRLFIFDSCPILIDHITRMTHDPDDVEDVLKVDSEDGDPFSGDDAYDAFRYGLMSRPAPSEKQVAKRRDAYEDDDEGLETSWLTV